MRSTIRQLQRAVTLAILGLLMTTGALLAAPTPTIFGASLTTDPSGNSVILLEWGTKENSTSVGGYNVYQAIAGSGVRNFEMVATVPNSGNGFESIELPAAPGLHYLYVTSFDRRGESKPSDTVVIEVRDQSLRWVPPMVDADTVTEGQRYQTRFLAEASNGAAIHYELYNAADSSWEVTFDQSTGQFSVTPGSAGVASFVILAWIDGDSTNFIAHCFSLTSLADPRISCGTITGRAFDAEGKPIEYGYAMAYGVDGTTSNVMSIFTTAEWELNVRPGTYMVAVYVDGFVGYFYPNMPDTTGATRFTIGCGDVIPVEFRLERDGGCGGGEFDTISGRVTRASDGSGVQAIVSFFSLDGSTGFAEQTDADGYYKVPVLRSGNGIVYEYIGHAVALEPGLAEQFYNLVEDPALATPISGSQTDIDFVLGEGDGGGGCGQDLSGVIINENREPLDGMVVAYLLADDRSEVLDVLYAETKDGSFSLPLGAGRYILQAIPYTDLYEPGYWRSGFQVATRDWEEADEINTSDLSNWDGFIMLRRADGDTSDNCAHGKITSSGKRAPGGIIAQEGTPVEGAVVYAIDKNDRVAGFAITDENGDYSINSIGDGEFKIVANKVGYRWASRYVLFDNESSDETIDLELDGTTSGVEEDAVIASALTVFPNPATTNLGVRFAVRAGKAQITLHDAMGRTIVDRNVATVEGENVANIDLAGIPAGVYVLRLQTGDRSKATTVTVTR